jgi:anthranilate synthase/indole-3-glycerol phosphate synthase/phosphoribosylanthranilate isomerase
LVVCTDRSNDPVRPCNYHTNAQLDLMNLHRVALGVTRARDHQLVLLDAARADGLSGGSGATLDWEHATHLVREGEGAGAGSDGMPLVLAGGLRPENVAEAVRTVRPFAVDVSGGVERADGQGKDAEKMRAFVQAAKGVEL